MDRKHHSRRGRTRYGYYHHEIPAFACQRPDRAVPRVGSARSFDRGLTWEDLGVVLEAPAENIACGSSNRFVVGGLGDVSVMRAPGGTDLFLFFSQDRRSRRSRGWRSPGWHGPTETRQEDGR